MAREFANVAATINAMLAKLDHSLKLQKQFTSDIAHELRTPLAVLLLDISQLPPGSGRDRAKADLKELGQLVDELLRFAQAEDVMTGEVGQVDIVAVARKVVEEAVPDALAKRQLLELTSATETLFVSGNIPLLKIAIRNLVDNALKYSPTRTVVAVAVGPGVGDRRRLRAGHSRRTSGPGIRAVLADGFSAGLRCRRGSGPGPAHRRVA